MVDGNHYTPIIAYIFQQKNVQEKVFLQLFTSTKRLIEILSFKLFWRGLFEKIQFEDFYYRTQSGNLSQKRHSICLSLGSQWFLLKKYLPKVPWDGLDSIKVLGKLPA